MSKESRTPKALFDINDFSRFYSRCWIRYEGQVWRIEVGTNLDGEPSSRNISLISLKGDTKKISLSTLQDWSVLSWPKLGWRNLDTEIIHLNRSDGNSGASIKGAYLPYISTSFPESLSNISLAIPGSNIGKEYESVRYLFDDERSIKSADVIFNSKFISVEEGIPSLLEGRRSGFCPNSDVAFCLGTTYPIEVYMKREVIGAVSESGKMYLFPDYDGVSFDLQHEV